VPFRALLKQLVAGVEGATGAILLESAGEAVQWHSEDESHSDRLRLRSAYVAVMLKNGKALSTRTEMGAVDYVVLQYEGATFVAQVLDKDYFVVVELAAHANIGQAIFRLQPLLETLRLKLAG
jgi:predicted regulator of Ras-like GTPase activity (Roadblock/LC7/MglB family)